MKSFTSLVGAAVLLNSSVHAALGKNSLWGAGISGLIDPSLWSHTSAPASTTTQWAAGIIPRRCYEEAVYLGLNPVDVQVFNVFYADCASPWGPVSMCRHSSASLS